jgi:two-component system chemotaxis sensor kinase CheA
MNRQDEEIIGRLRATFRVEAEDHLQIISTGLLDLEKDLADEQQTAIIETIHREAHSLKGAARVVNFAEIENLCQSLESVFANLKRQSITLSKNLLADLFQAVDLLIELLEEVESGRAPGVKKQSAVVIKSLNRAAEGKPDGEPSKATATVPAAKGVIAADTRSETVRIAAAKLDSLLFQVEEMLSVKLTAVQRANDMRELSRLIGEWEKKYEVVLPEARRARQQIVEIEGGQRAGSQSELGRVMEFLEWNQNFVRSLHNRLSALALTAEQDARTTSGMVDNLLSEMKQAVMLPFSTLLEIFPRLVRDLSTARGKKAELVVEGGEIEIDRRVLEEIKDPLIHLIRNAIDHGLEDPWERERRDKPQQGTITIAATQTSSNRIEIIVSDDGAGIDIAAVRARAAASGIITQREAGQLTDQAILQFIFHSGFSTSQVVTDISGHGLGLAILREKVEKLGGAASVETEPHLGTRFRIELPLTLATFRGVLVKSVERPFIVPTAGVERVLRINKSAIKTIENKESIELDGLIVTVVRLADVLGMGCREPAPDQELIQTIVLNAAGSRVAFAVDEVLSEQEVIVKSLGTQLARVRNVAGVTVLATGQIVPILNVSDLIKSTFG